MAPLNMMLITPRLRRLLSGALLWPFDPSEVAPEVDEEFQLSSYSFPYPSTQWNEFSCSEVDPLSAPGTWLVDAT